MPGHLAPTIRHHLEAAGLWRSFRRRRDTLKREGMPPEQANRQALRELLPGEALPPMPPALAGRAASEADVLRWVARNLDTPTPDPGTCPDGAAWALLRQCRDDPSMRLRVIGDLWPKLLPPGGRPEREGRDARGDERPTPELLAMLRAMAEAIRCGRP